MSLRRVLEVTRVSSMIELLIVHFFCLPKRTEERFSVTSSPKANEPKKRAPKMITSPRPYARYTSLIGAPGRAEVRTIFGLPARFLKYISTIYLTCTVIASPRSGDEAIFINHQQYKLLSSILLTAYFLLLTIFSDSEAV